MKLDLCRKRTCDSCPFRGGFHLSHSRRVEIHHAVMVDDQAFHCHSEVRYGDDFHGDTSRARQCAGATTLALREQGANQFMRAHSSLLTEDDAVPFENWSEWVAEPVFAEGAPSCDACSEPDCNGHTCEVVDSNCECPAGWMGGAGITSNPDRLERVAWCSACGSAMCDPCTSAFDDGGYVLCTFCGEDL